jgi:hypothetical protein
MKGWKEAELAVTCQVRKGFKEAELGGRGRIFDPRRLLRQWLIVLMGGDSEYCQYVR